MTATDFGEGTGIPGMNWSRIMRDYTMMLSGQFDAVYPGWSSDEAFMNRLRLEFAAFELAEGEGKRWASLTGWQRDKYRRLVGRGTLA